MYVDRYVASLIYKHCYYVIFSTDMVSDVQDSSSSLCVLHKKLWNRFRFGETLLPTFLPDAFHTVERKTKFYKQIVQWSWNFFNLIHVTVTECHHCMKLFVQIHIHHLIIIRVCTSMLLEQKLCAKKLHLLWFYFALLVTLTFECWKLTTVNVHCAFKEPKLPTDVTMNVPINGGHLNSLLYLSTPGF